MAENRRTITVEELAVLERMCDDFSLYQVLSALGHICHEKAEHLEQSYQDQDGIAERWRKRGLQVQATAEYLERMEALSFPRSPTHPPQGRLKR